MIVFYGRAKVGIAFKELCDFLGKECYIIDDKDEVIDTALLEKADIIIPTPGMKQTHTLYTTYANKIVSEMDMCYAIMIEQGLHPLSVGITGTDGKSTVTRLIAESLSQVLPDYQTHITGNFDEPLGQTILQILRKGTQDQKHIFVAECSSFMLYPTTYHFDVGIWTNFAPDHLNRHPNMDEYFAAKQKIVSLSDTVFVSQEIFNKLPPELQSKSTVYPTEYDLSTTNFVGKHNEKNCAVAFESVKALCMNKGLPLDEQKLHDAIGTIMPLQHRMQPVRTVDGITRYDDGKSTSAQSLGAALQSFDEPIIVICGGSDKGDSFAHLGELFKRNTVHGVFIGQTANQFADICNTHHISHTIADSMVNCVKIAREFAKINNVRVILFSPGCASFDMFKNYEDRAHQFLAEVNKIN